MTGSVRSQQWVRLPTTAVAANAMFANCSGPANPLGEDNRCPYPVSADTVDANLFDVAIFFVSPDGAARPYGEGPLIPVRTVAFGSIPVEATIQLVQSRDADGLPRALQTTLSDRKTESTPGGGADTTYFDAGVLRGEVAVRVVDVAVDGVDVGLGPCETPPFDIRLESEAASGPIGQELTWVDPDRSTYGISAGSFGGTVDIPPMAGCRTETGDDLSAVLSSFLAGPGNPVTVRYGTLGCFAMDENGGLVFGPTPPGATTPDEAGCFAYEQVPGDPRWNSIPVPREYPTYAPGDAGQ
ncbi:hypothetical protein [Nocardioides zeae]